MITRRQILNVIGPQGPSEVAEILSAIREDHPEALGLAGDHVSARVVRCADISFVDVTTGLTLIRVGAWTESGVWRVLPVSLVQRSEAVAAIAIVDALPGATGAELNRLHVLASGGHVPLESTGALLTVLTMDGLIEPRGIDTEAWLFSAESSVNDPAQWEFRVVA